jgi:hypothetical protein
MSAATTSRPRRARCPRTAKVAAALERLAAAQEQCERARAYADDVVAEVEAERREAAREAHALGASYTDMGEVIGRHRSRARQLVRGTRS